MVAGHASTLTVDRPTSSNALAVAGPDKLKLIPPTRDTFGKSYESVCSFCWQYKGAMQLWHGS
jgi:hypothetical protein